MKKEAKKERPNKNEGQKTELFIKQSEDADPIEDGGERRKTTLTEWEVVNRTDTHEGGVEGKVTL